MPPKKLVKKGTSTVWSQLLLDLSSHQRARMISRLCNPETAGFPKAFFILNDLTLHSFRIVPLSDSHHILVCILALIPFVLFAAKAPFFVFLPFLCFLFYQLLRIQAWQSKLF